MKKLAAILLALVICLSFSGWISGEAYSRYVASTEKMAEVDSVETKINGSMIITDNGVATEIFLQGLTREAYVNGAYALTGYVTMVMPDASSVTVRMYYKDGYLFQEALGQKIATKFDIDVVSAQFNTEEIVKDAIINSYITYDVPGGTRLDFELNPALMNTAVKEVLAGYSDSVTSAAAVNLHTMNYSIVVDESNVVKYYDMYISGGFGSVGGESLALQYIISGEITGVNTISELVFPSDLTSYEGYVAPPAPVTYTAPAATTTTDDVEDEAEAEVEEDAAAEDETETEAEAEVTTDEEETEGEVEE